MPVHPNAYLDRIEEYMFRIPKGSDATETETITAKIGFSNAMKKACIGGIHVYANDRLIVPFMRVGMMVQPNGRGNGIIGICKVQSVEPLNTKQDFCNTPAYAKLQQALGVYAEKYYYKYLDKSFVDVVDAVIVPDTLWVQCDMCLKWRKVLKDSVDDSVKWYCNMNSDAKHNDCDAPEEQMDQTEVTVTDNKYTKSMW